MKIFIKNDHKYLSFNILNFVIFLTPCFVLMLIFLPNCILYIILLKLCINDIHC